MSSSPRGVAAAVRVARATLRRVKLNLLFSLGYNSLCLPLAAGAAFPLARQRLPPEAAGLAMALSSVSVVSSR